MTSTINSDSVAQDVIRSFFERWRRLEDEKSVISEDLKDLFAEAKGTGFDTKVLRRVFRDATADASERAEFEAIYDLYASALGSALPRDAREDDHENPYEPGPQAQKIDGPRRGAAEAVETHSAAADEDDGRQLSVSSPTATAIELGDSAPSVGQSSPSNIATFTPKPFRPYCLNREVCAGYGHIHCYSCQKAHDAPLVEIEHHGSVGA